MSGRPVLELPIGRYAELSVPKGGSRTPETDSQAVSLEKATGEQDEHSGEVVEIHPSDLAMGVSIDTGASAEVFRASWHGHPVAVKVFFNVMPRTEKEMTSLNREVMILAQARHPNLVRLHGVCFARPVRIVTDFCEGGNLADLIYPAANSRDFELTWDQKIQIGTDTAAGMAYLHTSKPPIIHRDLKSPNLLLDKPLISADQVPLCKVSDFGLSKSVFDRLGAMTTEVGTLLWMAPEIFTSRYYDEKVDVYSFAMVLFEVMCEEAPFEDVERTQIESRVRKGERPDMEAVPPDRPEELVRIMVAGWSAEPASRPSFVEILSVLERLEPDASRPLAGHTRAPRRLQPLGVDSQETYWSTGSSISGGSFPSRGSRHQPSRKCMSL